MLLGELAKVLTGAQLIGAPDTEVTALTYDSRDVSRGALFVALRGGYADGHAFVEAAVTKGANAVVVETPLPVSVPQIVVGNSRRELATLADAFYGHPSSQLAVVGITGTDGKTTTSYILDHILRAQSRVTGMVGTVSVRVGDDVLDHETRQTTPESADIQQLLRLMVERGVDTAILEATSHGLDLHRLDHVRFVTGVVTNITREHLEHHKTVERYWRAKAILFERVLAAKGTAVINLDDAGSRSMLDYCTGARQIVTYSVKDESADLHARIERTDLRGSAGVMTLNGETCPFELPMVGEFNVANAMAATGAAIAQDVPFTNAVAALAKVPQVPGRMVSVDAGQPFGVVVDYAHTPESLEKVLSLLRRLRPNSRLIAVFGSAGERDMTKRPLQGEVSARVANITIVTSEDPRFEDAEAIVAQIAEGARRAGAVDNTSLFTETDRRSAIALAFQLAQPGDTVLLAGKGHERSIIWNGQKLPWDEVAVARELLSQRGGEAR